MTFSKKQIDAMCKAISDLVDDLHDNHEYDKNFFDHIDCPHGYRYVVTLLKLLQRHPHYSEWARGYLEAYAFRDGRHPSRC